MPYIHVGQKPRLGRKNVKQGVYVGADAVQLIDASRKKYDVGLRRTSGVRYVTSDPIGLDGGLILIVMRIRTL